MLGTFLPIYSPQRQHPAALQSPGTAAVCQQETVHFIATPPSPPLILTETGGKTSLSSHPPSPPPVNTLHPNWSPKWVCNTLTFVNNIKK